MLIQTVIHVGIGSTESVRTNWQIILQTAGTTVYLAGGMLHRPAAAHVSVALFKIDMKNLKPPPLKKQGYK